MLYGTWLKSVFLVNLTPLNKLYNTSWTLFFCERSIKGSFEKLRILLACFFTGNFCTFVFAYIVLTVTKVNYHFKEKKTHFITENFVLIRIWRKKNHTFSFLLLSKGQVMLQCHWLLCWSFQIQIWLNILMWAWSSDWNVYFRFCGP